MTCEDSRILSVAARSGRLGYVFLKRNTLWHWSTSERGASDATMAANILRELVRVHSPDVLVSENPDAGCRKGAKQREILRVFAAVGDDLPLLNLVVARRRRFANVYVEATAIAVRFPELRDRVPQKPPIWEKEPYRLVYFEALALIFDAGLITDDDADGAASCDSDSLVST